MTGARLVITKYNCGMSNEGILSFTIKDNQFQTVSFYSGASPAHVGDIFVAKVISVVANIHAAFIQYGPEGKGFLPLNKDYEPVLLNRIYDGRLLAGDELLVQMEKEAIRSKDPVFTTNLSLAGKYCVITNSDKKKGVSNKVSNKQNKNLLQQQIPEEIPFGVIVRTNAEELIEMEQLSDITEEIHTLCDSMQKLLQEGIHRTCFSKVFEAIAGYLLDIRDEYQRSFDTIVTDDQNIYDQLMGFLQIYLPDMVGNVSLYTDLDYSLHKLYSVETKIQELFGNKVWLRSGAYLVIEQTEAMYVIDVNSGKNNVKKENARYIYDINCEAAKEIMRQMTLRNLSGIIIVDFINMEQEELQQELFYEMKQLAKMDRVLTSVVDITPLGLMEITRKKVKKPLRDQMKVPKKPEI